MAEPTNNTTSNATPDGMINGSSADRRRAERSRNSARRAERGVKEKEFVWGGNLRENRGSSADRQERERSRIDARKEAKSLEAQKAARAGKVYDLALKYVQAYNEENIASGTNVTFGNDEFTLASSSDTTADGNTSSGGGSSSSHPWKMSLILDNSSNPIVTFDAEDTDVFIRNTNTLFYTLGDATGRPQNIENDDISLTSNATNYIYAEATWDSSTAVLIANHTFNIAVYTSEAPLFETETDTVEYQSVASFLIGTIQLNANNELTGTGITQFTKTRQFVDLLYANSLTVRGFAS
jgi:hypothetical protein